MEILGSSKWDGVGWLRPFQQALLLGQPIF